MFAFQCSNYMLTQCDSGSCRMAFSDNPFEGHSFGYHGIDTEGEN